ncbi:hypothetical protein TNCV_4865001 [Trichonephila clavipes]|nr:hypothetical protein TNCV_4865001 [Trichonephila clavipes]
MKVNRTRDRLDFYTIDGDTTSTIQARNWRRGNTLQPPWFLLRPPTRLSHPLIKRARTPRVFGGIQPRPSGLDPML